jgi:hypothetical protein
MSDLLNGMGESLILSGKAWANDREYADPYISSMRTSSDSIIGMLSYHIEKSPDEAIFGAFETLGRVLPPMLLTGPIELLIGKKKPALVKRIALMLAATFKAHKYATELMFAGLGRGGFTAADLAEMHAAIGFKITQKIVDRAFSIATLEQIQAVISALEIDSKVRVTRDNVKSALERVCKPREDRVDKIFIEWLLERSSDDIDVDLPALYYVSLDNEEHERNLGEVIRYIIEKDRFKPKAALVAQMKPGHKKTFTREFGYDFNATRSASPQSPQSPQSPNGLASASSSATHQPFQGTPNKLGSSARPGNVADASAAAAEPSSSVTVEDETQ